MLPYPQDNTLEGKLSTKPEQNKCTPESKTICTNCQLCHWKQLHMKYGHKSSTTEPGTMLGKCEYSCFQRQVKFVSNWLLNVRWLDLEPSWFSAFTLKNKEAAFSFIVYILFWGTERVTHRTRRQLRTGKSKTLHKIVLTAVLTTWL